MEKDPLYLKCIFEDGLVYFKITNLENPQDEYIYEGTELIFEDNTWNIDYYELTHDDIQEMYEDDFCNISKDEFEDVFMKANLILKK